MHQNPAWRCRHETQKTVCPGNPGIVAPDAQPSFITIARIARTRGNRGEVLADLYTDFPDRFNQLREVWLVPKEGAQRGCTGMRAQQGRPAKASGKGVRQGRPAGVSVKGVRQGRPSKASGKGVRQRRPAGVSGGDPLGALPGRGSGSGGSAPRASQSTRRQRRRKSSAQTRPSSRLAARLIMTPVLPLRTTRPRLSPAST